MFSVLIIWNRKCKSYSDICWRSMLPNWGTGQEEWQRLRAFSGIWETVAVLPFAPMETELM